MIQKNIFAVINRILLIICCTAFVCSMGVNIVKVCFVLVIISICGIGVYCEKFRYLSWIIAVFSISTVVFKEFNYGLPVIVYESCNMLWDVIDNKNNRDEKQTYNIIALITDMAAIVVIAVNAWNYLYKDANAFLVLIEVIQVIVAVMLNYYNNKNIRLKMQLIELRDDSSELNMALRTKNKYLIEKQDSQIYSATLKERNRIAREIHDNVGHMLSRSLLQTGAAIAVNKQENLAPLLKGIKETLDCAMTSIRNSVHDLHDESIDLKSTVADILGEMKNYHVEYEYDMTSEVPRTVKYCMISVIKEAVTNIMKHSNADSVEVVLREHPAFYQLFVKDNGRCINHGDGTGIGMENMNERVAGLNGTINISKDNGYKIFICIPKSDIN